MKVIPNSAYIVLPVVIAYDLAKAGVKWLWTKLKGGQK
jgi:hypothetical protein